jgi:Flp pilus assembly protein TadG
MLYQLSYTPRFRTKLKSAVGLPSARPSSPDGRLCPTATGISSIAFSKTAHGQMLNWHRDSLTNAFCGIGRARWALNRLNMANNPDPFSIRKRGRLLSCTRGNVAQIFALLALPLAVFAGFGVDIWRQNNATTSVQNAIDAAALAAAASELEEVADLKAVVEDYLAGNVTGTQLSAGYTTEVELIDEERIRVVVQGNIPALFSGLIGRDELPVKATATATRGSGAFVEIALVLDNTWSMSASGGTTTKIDGLKTAAAALVDEVMVREDGKVRISVIPYADYVNVGMNNRSASWLNVPADYTSTWTPSPEVCFDVPVEWTSCTAGVMGTCTRFRDGVPESVNCWTTPPTCTSQPVSPPRTRRSCSGGGTPITTWNRWYGCVGSRNTGSLRLNDTMPTSRYPGLMQESQTCLNPILPLSETKATVLSEINGLVVNIGSYRPETYIPGGLIWGINALSPEAPLTDGRDYGPTVRKIIVLMTDGENTLRYEPSNGTHTPPSGASSAAQLAQTNNDVGSLCTYAKSQNMEIYTVSLGVTSVNAGNMLRACATSAAHAHAAANTTALQAAFRQVARSINAVRLTE